MKTKQIQRKTKPKPRASPLRTMARTYEDIVLASLARVGTTSSSLFHNNFSRGIILVIDVSAIVVTPSITVALMGRDSVHTKEWTILTSAAITTVSTVVLKVYPGMVAAANLVANDVLPRNWRVVVTHADADSITYSVVAHLIP